MDAISDRDLRRLQSLALRRARRDLRRRRRAAVRGEMARATASAVALVAAPFVLVALAVAVFPWWLTVGALVVAAGCYRDYKVNVETVGTNPGSAP